MRSTQVLIAGSWRVVPRICLHRLELGSIAWHDGNILKIRDQKQRKAEGCHQPVAGPCVCILRLTRSHLMIRLYGSIVCMRHRGPARIDPCQFQSGVLQSITGTSNLPDCQGEILRNIYAI